MPTLKQQYLWVGILLVILTLVCLPRFNRIDIGFGEYTTQAPEIEQDYEYYLSYVHYFRGQGEFTKVNQPFSFRPLVPFIAAYLPFDAMTGINLINVISLQIGLIFLYLLMLRLGISFYGAVIGCLMYAISFPVFYYGAIGYVDSPLLAFITASLYCLLQGQTILFFLIFLAGVFCKDVIVILIPVFFIYHLLKKDFSWFQTFALTALLGVLWIICLYITSTYFAGGNYEFRRSFSMEIVMNNLSRIRTTLSFLLTLGLPGVLAIWFFFRHFFETIKHPALAAFIIGCAAVMATAIYGLAGAYWDGRYIWIAYPMAIPFAMYFLDRYLLSQGLYTRQTA